MIATTIDYAQPIKVAMLLCKFFSPTFQNIILHFLQELDLMVSGSADLTTKIWSLSTGKVVKSIGEFSHLVVHLVIHNSSQHSLQNFKGKNILITMTKDFLTLFSWSEIGELSDAWNYQIPLNPSDCFVWKKIFFTPGMQLYGQKIAFVIQVAMFDTHTVGDADLVIADANTGTAK